MLDQPALKHVWQMGHHRPRGYAGDLMRLLFVLALAGCGDNGLDRGAAHSGSRLKLGWYEYSDGTRQRVRDWYFDRERGERCTPARWSDGSRYCTPASDPAVYVDLGCQTALGR